MNISKEVKFTIVTIFLFFCWNTFSQSNQKFTVILDAGHGGKDPGNSYHGFVEKEIALKTTLKLEKYLKKDGDIKVVYTRKSDVFIDLKDRPKKANTIDANLFVSIHCNSVDNPIPSGTETFVMGLARSKGNLEIAKQENSVILLEKNYKQTYKGFDPKNPETLIGLKMLQEDYLDRSINLASKIEKNFKNILHRKSRGIKQTPLWVLDAAYMPSVLIELGFLSNKEEGRYLNSEEGQNNMAEAIALAIIDYKKEYFGTQTNNYEELPSKKVVKNEMKYSSKNIKTKPSIEKQDLQKQESKIQNSDVVFKVLFATGNKNIKLSPSNFKGLKNVMMTTSNRSLYKYTYGLTSDYNIAKENLKVVKSKGYSSAYIIAIKDGKNISVEEALK
ncbi:N-acetylmuramoyl-L-alanine amidase family protein [Flavobacterium glaciei]|uniref:N-acetylmuramoyl-L-alanine amidase n=1 Tax=Flavobacterium glaciei TaxID=386300 RepID=A0A562PJA0_9FLAO|nr:N-acetylmuramoyl-L-alanine amidase [Flavobacterium glaciei]RDI50292.1 N-acetylmuramoyl-L-alanine amidase [Flavobacterium glaciei]TWI44542.1 N-acetylmuramoyl-L-alanine amidase [Flavobacterium glaciei]